MIHIERHGPVVAIRMSRSLLGRPLCWTAAYWVDGLLIDTGPLCTADGLVRILAQLHVDKVVVTHCHENQIGGLAAVRECFPHASIYAPMHALPVFSDPKRLKLNLYQRLFWGTPAPVEGVCGFDEIDNVLQTPEYTFRVLETPGHTRDHVSFFEPNRRWLFCGDAFIGGKEDAWTAEAEMFGVVSSLRALASLRPERLFPGSGNVRRTPLPELQQKIRQLVKLAQEVGKLESVGLTTQEIAACLFKEEPRITFWTRGHYSTINLVKACRSYNAVFAPIHPVQDRTDEIGSSNSGRYRNYPQSSSTTQ